MSTPYIISRSIDPFFAITVGIAAFAVRVNREEKEKGKSFQDTVASVRRRIDLAWNETQKPTTPSK